MQVWIFVSDLCFLKCSITPLQSFCSQQREKMDVRFFARGVMLLWKNWSILCCTSLPTSHNGLSKNTIGVLFGPAVAIAFPPEVQPCFAANDAEKHCLEFFLLHCQNYQKTCPITPLWLMVLAVWHRREMKVCEKCKVRVFFPHCRDRKCEAHLSWQSPRQLVRARSTFARTISA